MRTGNRFVLAGVALLALAVTAGCKPEYPACDTDRDCKPKEFCVARKCQQCRNAADCGEGRECTNGRCVDIPGYCRDASQCTAGQVCAANRCRACGGDGECPSGQICVQGRCGATQCSKDDDCPQDKDCVNGRCVGSTKKSSADRPPCDLATVYFGFDKAALTSQATDSLAGNAACLKKTERAVNLVGRADPRGTTEYNMALSDRRAQAVKDYLGHSGIAPGRLSTVPRGDLDATGSDESGWANDRRVDSEWQ